MGLLLVDCIRFGCGLIAGFDGEIVIDCGTSTNSLFTCNYIILFIFIFFLFVFKQFFYSFFNILLLSFFFSFFFSVLYFLQNSQLPTQSNTVIAYSATHNHPKLITNHKNFFYQQITTKIFSHQTITNFQYKKSPNNGQGAKLGKEGSDRDFAINPTKYPPTRFGGILLQPTTWQANRPSTGIF